MKIFYPVQEWETYWHITDCQMPYFMIVLISYINLWNLSWIKKKMSTFEEYGAFNFITSRNAKSYFWCTALTTLIYFRGEGALFSSRLHLSYQVKSTYINLFAYWFFYKLMHILYFASFYAGVYYVTSVCQSVNFCVHSISPSLIDGFFWNFVQMFTIPRQCAELINQSCPVKVKVKLQGQSSNSNISCPLYNSKMVLIFLHEILYKYKDLLDSVQKRITITLLSVLT